MPPQLADVLLSIAGTFGTNYKTDPTLTSTSFLLFYRQAFATECLSLSSLRYHELRKSFISVFPEPGPNLVYGRGCMVGRWTEG